MGRGPFPLLRTRKPPNFPASVTSSSGRAGLVFVQVSLKKSYGVISKTRRSASAMLEAT